MLRRLMRDESGQATTEYTLILAVVVALCVTLINKAIKPMLQKVIDAAQARIEQTLFKGDLHTLRIK